ncbi:MAG: outer membrane protein assembly factor BamD [Bacteroidales bacterium]|nr:outer membrane protein assembly factor BamD [Bacteroidales bacterium]
MRYKRLLAVFAIAIAALTACKSQYELLLEGNDVDAKYKAAFELFEAGKYQKAAQLFESLAQITSGTERDDTVQYYWGLSNYKYKDYYTAEANFDSFISRFPRSPFTPDAKFYRLDCLFRATLRYELDQTPTYKAITAISEYLMEYPDGDKAPICQDMLTTLSNRLDRKAYENARLYYKMEEYKAAQVAFRNVLKDDAENIYREDILYYTAMSSYKYAEMSVKNKQHERFLVFLDDYYNFIGEYPDSHYRKELDNLYARAKEK